MAVWILVAVWVALGLGVFFIAFRGGGRQRPSSRTGGGSGRGTTIALIVASVVFGIALPAVVLATSGEDAKSQAPGGVDLNASQVEGREMFVENCSTCHTLKAVNAVGRVGPNLDQLRPPEELVANAIEDGRARGNGQMPADLVTGEDVKDIASFVAATAGR